MTRVFNFSAGPATLPLTVLEEIQSDLMSYAGTGMSVLEMSHRGKTYIDIHEEVRQRLRNLLNVSNDYEILLLQGGGRLQNVMIPMNLLTTKDETADYLVTGFWGKSSSEDVPHFGRLHLAWDGESTGYTRLPTPSEINLTPNAAYVHFTSNETIHGVQYASSPGIKSAPLIADCSSDLLSKPMDVSKFGMVYACAQKTSGIAGTTIVMIRKDLLERSGKRVPGYLNYAKHAKSAESMLNTPPTFSVYVTGLICKWLQNEIGGLEKIERMNIDKAALLYTVIDQHAGFYRGHANKPDRSVMNVVFRTPTAELDEKFAIEAKGQMMSDLKGHRVLGGIRASIYNAMPLEGVQTLAQFMTDFALKNG